MEQLTLVSATESTVESRPHYLLRDLNLQTDVDG